MQGKCWELAGLGKVGTEQCGAAGPAVSGEVCAGSARTWRVHGQQEEGMVASLGTPKAGSTARGLSSDCTEHPARPPLDICTVCFASCLFVVRVLKHVRASSPLHRLQGQGPLTAGTEASDVSAGGDTCFLSKADVG